MNQVAYFGDLCRNRDRLRAQLASLFEIEFKPLESSLESRLGQYTVFDFDLNDTTHLLKLKDKLKSRPKDAKVIFVTEKASRLQDTRALAIGATDVIHRPFDGRALLAKLWGEVQSLADEKPEFADGSGSGVTAAADTLRGIFSAACSGASPDSDAIQSAGDGNANRRKIGRAVGPGHERRCGVVDLGDQPELRLDEVDVLLLAFEIGRAHV